MSIEDVQNKLGAIIKKPKLQDTLLQKPPFRFLHDIVMEVIAVTGFGNGLYQGDELNGKAIKDKEEKINFLNKIIVCTSLAVGKEIDVNSSKIVAGKEYEKTCGWLVALAEACTSKANFADCASKAVQKVGVVVAGEGKRGDEDEDDVAKKNAEADAIKERENAEKAKNERSERERSERERSERERSERERSERERSEKDAADRKRREEDAAAEERRRARDTERPTTTSRPSGPRSSPIPTAPIDAGISISSCDGDMNKTIEYLQPIFEKPKLTTKLLEKPPFRFLHDIFLAVIKETDFGAGLYAGVELDGKAIDSKEGKQAFLDKMINCTYIYLGGYPGDEIVRSSKIVAGKDPEKTNLFLQHLSIAANRCKKGHSCKVAVEQTLAGEQPQPNTGRPVAPPTEATRSEGKAADPEPREPAKPKASRFDEEPRVDSKPKVIAKPEEDRVNGASQPANTSGERKIESDYVKLVQPLNLSSVENEEASGIKRSERPKTSRKKPPKIKDNAGDESKASKNVAAPVGIFVDGDQNDDSDDDQGTDTAVKKSANTEDIDPNATHSKLVQKILEEEKKPDKKEKQGKANGTDEGKKDDAGGIRMGKIRKTQRGNETTAPPVELNELRSAIQKLTQSTNPLGKCMDYVHDDLDTMSKELEQWKQEYRAKCDVYEEEAKKTEEDIQPLQLRLLDVEEKIRDQVQKIHSVKSRISKNEAQISELLRLVVSS